MPRLRGTPLAAAAPASRYEFGWAFALILSFSYELPLVTLFGADRTSPRLYDLLAVLGAVTILPRRWNPRVFPSAFWEWTKVVAVFCGCALFYGLLLPFHIWFYSAYYALKYLEGFMVIACFLGIPWSDKQKLLFMRGVTAGGAFVALWCILEYRYGAGLMGQVREIQISEDKVYSISDARLLGPLSLTYFHLATFSSFAAVITFSRIAMARQAGTQCMLALLGAFVAWPAMFCGSRSGLALVGLGSLGVWMLMRKSSARAALAVIGGTLLVGALMWSFRGDGSGRNLTVERMQRFQDSERESLAARLLLGFTYTIQSYMYPWLLPFVGAGFYVAPMESDGVSLRRSDTDIFTTAADGREMKFRIGYGIHNAYLFPLEQGGILGLMFAARFFWQVFRSASVARAMNRGGRGALGIATLATLFSFGAVFLSGQIFWIGFGTGHMNTMYVLIFCLSATTATVSTNWAQGPRQSGRVVLGGARRM